MTDPTAPAAPPLSVEQANPQPAHLMEATVESQVVYEGHFLHVRRDRVRLPDLRESWREYIRHPGAVVIVPLLDDQRVVTERQYRYPLARAMLEFPAGKLSVGEPPLQCAVRELAEETGYTASEWGRAGVLHNAIAYSDEAIEIWFARGLCAGPQRLDEGEFLDVTIHTVDDLERLAGCGELTDAKTLIALMWLRNWQAGRWTIDWRPAP